MAYADQKMSGNRVTALIIVALIHVVVGYALVTGLAFEAAKKVIQRVTTVDVKEEKKEEPPPPPPKKAELPPPPPIVAPPPKLNLAPPPPIITVPTLPPPPPPIVLAPPAPPPPPPPSQAKPARPKNQGSWAARIQENYPASALRQEKEGRVGVRVTVGPDGRVSACTVTSSSGTAALDEAACSGMQRYARYEPALDDAGHPTTGSVSTAIVYKINQ
jgi:protein TonB